MAENKKESRTNPFILFGLLLAALLGILVFVFIQNLQSQTKVYVAKGDIPAYSVLRPGNNIVTKEVPKGSVTDNDLTANDFKKGETKITRLEILDNQRLDARATVASSLNSTLGVVKEGEEQVVAVNTSFKGIIAGITRPGSVVNIYTPNSGGDNGGGELLAENVKVLGVGSGGQVANNIVSGNKVKENSENNGNSILVIVAVKNADVNKLSTDQNVTMSLNPYLEFDAKGTIKAAGNSGVNPQTSTETQSSTSEQSTDTSQESTQETTTP